MANRVPHYLICTTICHGACELVLAKQLQLKNRRDLNPLADKNGEKSILINTINDFLGSRFKTEAEYIKKHKDCLKVSKGVIVNTHKIFTIMDKDDISDNQFNKYKNKEMFKHHWWGERGFIEPIYFNPNMDVVFTKHGFPIDTSGNKPAQYLKYLTKDYEKAIDMLKSLPMSESNISVYLDFIEKNK